MRTIFFVALFFIILLTSCKKNGPVDPFNNSYTGALDSVAFFRTDDSVHEYDQFTVMRNYFDDQKRITKIEYGTFANPSSRLFIYAGNNPLPFKMTDSVLYTDYAYVSSHLFNYDNLSRLVFDSIITYTRYYGSQSVFNMLQYSLTTKYGQNYYTKFNSRYPTLCSNTDTTSLNNSGDIIQFKKTCDIRHKQTVNAYYPEINPLSTLNIHPLYDYLSNSWFWIGIQNLSFNLAQPKMMYKKASGTNTTFYRHWPDDWNELLFTIEKDANNRIKKLIISNYTYSRDFSGNWYLDSKFYSGYKFFYHD
ncbi:MAG: hypothetical protein U0V75_11620 [Ferruginibacter sp.]